MMKTIFISIILFIIVIHFNSCRKDLCEELVSPPMYLSYIDKSTGMDLLNQNNIEEDFYILLSDNLDTVNYSTGTIFHGMDRNVVIVHLYNLDFEYTFGKDQNIEFYANFRNDFDTIRVNFLEKRGVECIHDFIKEDFYVNDELVDADKRVVVIYK